MRILTLQTAVCLTLLTLATTSTFASVRGKPSKPIAPATRTLRVAQSDADYSVNAVPVPADVEVKGERVIRETTVAPTINTVNPSITTVNPTITSNEPNCTTATRATVAPVAERVNYVAVPVMVVPVMIQAAQPMQMPAPMMQALGCSACGGMSSMGLSPASAAGYDQAFGPGLYRSGAEVGQNHFPYYSYRRPWYFPGQPSFQRSTDYVW